MEKSPDENLHQQDISRIATSALRLLLAIGVVAALGGMVISPLLPQPPASVYLTPEQLKDRVMVEVVERTARGASKGGPQLMGAVGLIVAMYSWFTLSAIRRATTPKQDDIAS